MPNQTPDQRPFALATATFGVALLFVAWMGDFEDSDFRIWAGVMGALLLVCSTALTTRPPK